jgi:threonine dehydrogenase-like Zn-dependent dehydrogenase
MKAILLIEKDRLELVEVEVPALAGDQLLIRTGAATICTSDVNDLHENPFGIPLPVVLGHEGAGTVAALGTDVSGFQVGDRVAADPVHPCGACASCRRGYGHLCLQMGHFGLNMPGTMAEYFLVRQDRARRIPDTVDFTTAALEEPVAVCLEALDQARLAPGASLGASLLILGDGPFGLLMARLAARLDLAKVVLAGLLDFRLSFAGAAATVNLSSIADRPAALLDLSGGDGYDAVILAAGSRQAVRDGQAVLKPKGRLVVFAALTGETPLDLLTLHVREQEIVGACNARDRLDAAVAALSDPALRLPELVTHRFPLEDFRRAFHLAEFGKGQALKIAFVFDDQDRPQRHEEHEGSTKP